jgi:putative transposase
LILEEHRQKIVPLIIEAQNNGARLLKACELIGISVRTFQRWRDGSMVDRRKGSLKRVVRKLSQKDRAAIIKAVNEKAYRDLSPHQIVPLLLEENRYLASSRTFYRVLKEHKQLAHRNNARVARRRNKPPTRRAEKSNTVYCWDITWLPRNIGGLFYYAYIVIDLYDRSIVGWSVHDTESEIHARDLFERITLGRQIRFEYLHSDNGHPMKGVTLTGLLQKLNIKASYNRPRQSNDNPYIEAFFRTLKYYPSYPGRFHNINQAREWIMNFVNWYNTKHRHSSIDYVTPAQMRSGEAKTIFQKRNETMREAKQQHPERWGSRKLKLWGDLKTVVLNPEKIKTKKRHLC